MVVVLPVLEATAAALLFGLSAPLAKLLVGAASPWLLAGLLELATSQVDIDKVEPRRMEGDLQGLVVQVGR